MILKVLAALLLLPGLASAVTVEVVKLYQPLSFHNTDGVGDEEDGESIQAAVMMRPYAITGAIPEDLVKAVASPHQISSNAPGYDVKDANLLNLCKVTMTAEMKNEKLLVRFDVSKLAIPEDLDIAARHVVRLSIEAVRRTLKEYFKDNVGEDGFEVSIAVTGTKEGNASLKDLAVRFKIGE